MSKQISQLWTEQIGTNTSRQYPSAGPNKQRPVYQGNMSPLDLTDGDQYARVILIHSLLPIILDFFPSFLFPSSIHLNIFSFLSFVVSFIHLPPPPPVFLLSCILLYLLSFFPLTFHSLIYSCFPSLLPFLLPLFFTRLLYAFRL